MAGHQGTRTPCPLVGARGTREDIPLGRFGTVSPRVQIPGPRPKSEYDDGFMAGADGASDHRRITISPRNTRAEGIVEAYLTLDAGRVAEVRIQASMHRDYQAWHDQYDDPNSALAERLRIVQLRLGELLTARPAGPVRLISMCAGQGRDVFGVILTRQGG